MNKKIKKTWLERLRNSETRQGRGRMRNYRDEFCPLGILCDIIGPKGWIKHTDTWYHLGTCFSPSEIVLTDVGLSRPEIVWIYQWNDKDRRTFPEIAKQIELVF